MKIIKIVFLFTLFISCSQPTNSGEKTYTNNEIKTNRDNNKNIKIDAVISKDRFTINDLQIDTLITIKEIEKVIGVSTRKTIFESNNIYTYDNFGLLIYENILSKKIKSIDFELSNRDFEFSSKNSFSGHIFINKSILKKGISYGEIKQISQIEIKPVAPKMYSIKNIKNKVYLEFLRNEQLRLISVSTEVFDETDEENSLGWTKKSIESNKKYFAKDKKLIEISKLKGFDVDKFADCYFNKISKTLTTLQASSPNKKSKKIISKIMQECEIQSKN